MRSAASDARLECRAPREPNARPDPTGGPRTTFAALDGAGVMPPPHRPPPPPPPAAPPPPPPPPASQIGTAKDQSVKISGQGMALHCRQKRWCVNLRGKVEPRVRRYVEEASASGNADECRKRLDDVKNGGGDLLRDSAWGMPLRLPQAASEWKRREVNLGLGRKNHLLRPCSKTPTGSRRYRIRQAYAVARDGLI